MIRFKVVKGSHILLAAAIVLLLSVIIYIGVQMANSGSASNGAEVIETSARAEHGIHVEIIPDPTEAPIPKKKILIYHTHTHEAYTQMDDDLYEALETWRTADETHSVVQVGAVLAEKLRGLGYEVTHDTTDHEQDDLSSAYVRSLQTLEGYTEPFDLYIDLHRDAYSEGMESTVENDGTQYALIMLLIGRGDTFSEAEKPHYSDNLQYAQKLTEELNRKIPGICRNVTVKKGRYNQHIGTPSVLIEVGHNLNTLEQAVNSTSALADAIDALFHSS